MTEARYADALTQDGRNLTRLALDRKIALPLYREQQVGTIVGSINRGRSVMLVGEPGVGKTTILHGVAAELRRSSRELWEVPSISFLTGTRYLGDWQSKAESILAALKKRKGVLSLPDVWNVLTIGTSSNDPSSLFDYLRPKIQAGQLQLLGEVTPERFQAMQTMPLLTSLFDVVYVEPLDAAQITHIVEAYAAEREIGIETSGISNLMELCKRFLPSDTGPGQLLRLVQRLADYQREKVAINEPEPIDQAFIEKVFSIYSGLPRFVVSRSTTIPSREIREWFRERIIGQERAIEAVVEVITLFKAGLHDPNRPIGTLLFVGPTGVGKTELAKALAKYLFGSESRLLRFDLSEFKDYHAFQMLVGDPDRPLQPARLLDPVRAQPFQVILFDEIEKAHSNVWDMLLQLLDEGHVSPPNGLRANFRNTIVIATSNVGSQDALKSPIGFLSNAPGQVPIKSLESVFRPELLNRFQHIVTFDGLTRENVRRIATREIQQLLVREGITSRNLAVEVGEDVLDAVVESGYDREYGARALKRQVQQRILFPIAGRLMESQVTPGSILKLDIVPKAADERGPGITRVRILDTAESREQKREAAREQAASSQSRSRAELMAEAAKLAVMCSELGAKCARDKLSRRMSELDRQRLSPHFWEDGQTANEALLEIDEIKDLLARLDTLSDRVAALSMELQSVPSALRLEHIDHSLSQASEQIQTAERELTRMGSHGKNDSLVAITPIGNAKRLRDLLFETYRSWAKARGHHALLLADPLEDSEGVFFALRGAYAFGYLQRENGLHRLRNREEHEVVRVTVAAWSHARIDVTFGRQRALKRTGKFGDKIRSQVEVVGNSPFVLQSALTIAENRDMACEVADSWTQSLSSDVVVRRYDLDPFLLKDHLTGISSGRQSILKPSEFHELLCKRVDTDGDQLLET